MTRAEFNRAYAKTPQRKAYLKRYMKEHYDRVHFYKLKQSAQFQSNAGLVTLTSSDEIYIGKEMRWTFKCPSRHLVGLLIPRGLLVRTMKFVRKVSL